MIKLKLTFIAFICFQSVFSQDVHFSQYYASPLVLNPATTGMFDGDFRFNSCYKDQWRTISNPYKTFFASADAALLKGKWKNGFLGCGLAILSDRAGAGSLGLTQINFSLSYSTFVNASNSLTAGLQLGYDQRSINYETLKWDNQFNGLAFDPSRGSGEQGLSDISFVDMSCGLLWNAQLNDRFKMNMGFSVAHLNKSNLSFYRINADTLKLRIIYHGSMNVSLNNSRGSLLPGWMIVKQGNSFEINVGGFVKYSFDRYYSGHTRSPAIYVGCFYRWKDAIILAFRLDFRKNLTMGLSYDFTLSPLVNANRTLGGAELSLQYVGLFSQEKKHQERCPEWVN